MSLKSLHILALLCFTSEIFAAFMKHKYIIDLESVYVCPDNDRLEIPIKKFRVDRINRTHRALSVDFSLAHALDNTMEAATTMEKASGGGWTSIPVFPYQQDPCRKIMDSPLQAAKDLFVKFAKAVGVKHPEKCDFPAGHYLVDRYPLDLTGDIPFWGGRFRSNLVIRRVKDKKKVFCITSIISFKEMPE